MFSVFLNSTFFFHSPFSSSVFCPWSFSCSKQHVMALTIVHLSTPLSLPPKCIINNNIINLITQIVESRVGKILCHWGITLPGRQLCLIIIQINTHQIIQIHVSVARSFLRMLERSTKPAENSLLIMWLLKSHCIATHCITHRHILHVKLLWSFFTDCIYVFWIILLKQMTNSQGPGKAKLNI